MLRVDYKHCTGCEACIQKCPKHCISMVKGEFGFLYPETDVEDCINCGLCESVCPIEKKRSEPEEQQAYAAVHRDLQTLINSSSGGAFSALAEAILKSGGIVYGVCMDDFFVHHVRVDNADEIDILRGSKYVQSRIGNAFICTKRDLEEGKQVLFSGTPCQIDGLKSYLSKDYENLTTIDIVCHGVGSQEYFDGFLSVLKKKWPGITDLKFRAKTFAGWSCSAGSMILYGRGKKSVEKPFYCHENYYYRFFIQGDIYRQACYSCKYARRNRVGDITLGDFWGVESLNIPLNTYHGCSLVIVNNDKGQKLFEEAELLQTVPVSMEEATKRNDQLVHPTPMSDKRRKRLQEYNTMTGQDIADNYRKNEGFGILSGEIKKLLPYRVKRVIRRYRG